VAGLKEEFLGLVSPILLTSFLDFRQELASMLNMYRA
jgi:hypothetical protein